MQTPSNAKGEGLRRGGKRKGNCPLVRVIKRVITIENGNAALAVIPAQAGIQLLKGVDSRLRGNDELMK